MPSQRGKKRRGLGWIPTGILAAIILGTIVTTAVLINNGLGEPAPRPTAGQVTDLNWSVFTDEGLRYIASQRLVRIDMSTQPVDAAALGLAADDTLVLEPIDTLDTMLDYSLIINGGADAGGAKFVASQISVDTAGGVVTSVRAQLSEVVNFRQTLSRLQNQADVFGWGATDTDAIFATAEAATRDGVPYSFTLGPAERIGVPVSATAFCETNGYCVVEYDVAPAVR